LAHGRGEISTALYFKRRPPLHLDRHSPGYVCLSIYPVWPSSHRGETDGPGQASKQAGERVGVAPPHQPGNQFGVRCAVVTQVAANDARAEQSRKSTAPGRGRTPLILGWHSPAHIDQSITGNIVVFPSAGGVTQTRLTLLFRFPSDDLALGDARLMRCAGRVASDGCMVKLSRHREKKKVWLNRCS